MRSIGRRIIGVLIATKNVVPSGPPNRLAGSCITTGSKDSIKVSQRSTISRA
jgi:hypothetical protein